MATLQITNDPIDYDVGDLGEIEFDRWCTKAGIVANKAQRDRKGWDFIIELPATDPRYQHDELTAKVQVKATKSGSESARIKLDNLARMATDPTPWFVLYFSFNDAGDILSAHMVHIDAPFVANAHHVINAEQPGALHKTRIAVQWDVADAIKHDDPRELLTRIRDAIGGSIWSYYEAKGRWNTSALTRRISGSLSFPGTPAEAYARLADLAVGLVDEIPADVTEILDISTRKSEIPEGAVIESSVISIEGRSPEPATVEAQFGSERVVLRCSMLTSAVFKAIPVEHHKLRVFTELLSVILGRGGLSMHVDVPPRTVSLSALGQTGRLLRLLANPGATLTVRAENLAHTVEVKDHHERSAELRDAAAWERAARIANYVGLPHDLEVLPSLTLVQKNQIASLEMLINRVRTPTKFVVDLHQRLTTISGQAAVIVAPKVVLGDFGVVAIGAVRGHASVDGGQLAMDRPAIELMRVEWRPRHEMTREYIEELLAEAVATLKAQEIPIITISNDPLIGAVNRFATALGQHLLFITSRRASRPKTIRMHPDQHDALRRGGCTRLGGADLVPDGSVLIDTAILEPGGLINF